MKYPVVAEITFFSALVLLIVALFFYAQSIKYLLKLLRLKIKLWVFPFIGAVLVFVSGIFHFYKMVSIYPELKRATFYNFFNLILSNFRLSFFENLFLTLGGLLCFIAGYRYYRMVSK